MQEEPKVYVGVNRQERRASKRNRPAAPRHLTKEDIKALIPKEIVEQGSEQ